MIIRCELVGGTNDRDPLRVDLPTYSMVAEDATLRRAFADVPNVDVPTDVAAFVSAYPMVDLTTPLPVPFPPALARTWAEHLARRYDLGNVRWHPEIA